jgi:hypothetical protein
MEAIMLPMTYWSKSMTESDPQSARECIAHLRDVLTIRDFKLAVALIELYAQRRHLEGMDQIKAIYDKIFEPADEGGRVQ